MTTTLCKILLLQFVNNLKNKFSSDKDDTKIQCFSDRFQKIKCIGTCKLPTTHYTVSILKITAFLVIINSDLLKAEVLK